MNSPQAPKTGAIAAPARRSGRTAGYPCLRTHAVLLGFRSVPKQVRSAYGRGPDTRPSRAGGVAHLGR